MRVKVLTLVYCIGRGSYVLAAHWVRPGASSFPPFHSLAERGRARIRFPFEIQPGEPHFGHPLSRHPQGPTIQPPAGPVRSCAGRTWPKTPGEFLDGLGVPARKLSVQHRPSDYQGDKQELSEERQVTFSNRAEASWTILGVLIASSRSDNLLESKSSQRDPHTGEFPLLMGVLSWRVQLIIHHDPRKHNKSGLIDKAVESPLLCTPSSSSSLLPPHIVATSTSNPDRLLVPSSIVLNLTVVSEEERGTI